MIAIKYRDIKKVAFIILALPFLCFAIGWLKWYWAIAASLATILCVFFGVFREKASGTKEYMKDCFGNTLDSEYSVNVSWKILIIFSVIAIIWIWQSGIGGFWTQSDDFIFRNAIFRDIVLRDWPVIYPVTGHALVYYIGYWLFPALFGKLMLLLGASEETAFSIANSALFVWTFVIIILLFLLIIYTLKLSDSKKQIFAVILFILFSGADIIGNIGYSWEYINYHYEWWASSFQFSSFTTCLFWVFNQAVPAWLCFMCVLHEKTMKNYIFIGMMCLFNAPLPFVGWLVFCLFFAIRKGISIFKERKQSKEKSRKLKTFFLEIPSVSNILAALIIFPIAGTYLLSNLAIHGSGAIRMAEAEMVTEEAAIPPELQFSSNPVVNYFSFICIEFALYMIFMAWKYKKNAIYYVTFASLLIIPLLKIGGKHDFAMRASIPALVMVFFLVAKFLIEEKAILKLKGSIKRMTYIMLVIFLIIGSCTPLMEFLRGFHEVSEYGIGNEKYDNVYTLGCDGPYDEPGKTRIYSNFVAIDLDEQIFFKVFAKRSSAIVDDGK
ncbi:MAG: hypothetical protein IKP88_07540 [Lachnospiraceae bacterium]|nr:hypothetical protein [Lachnospiraceae bacterium]